MFPAGNNAKPVPISDRTLKGLTAAVNRFCGTKRTEKGKLSKSAGILPEMEAVVKEFAKNPATVQQATIEMFKAQEKSSNPSPSMIYYAAFMEKLQKSGKDFILPEITRLSALINADNVPAPKSDEFSIRRNILESFAEALELQVPELDNADLVADEIIPEEEEEIEEESEELL